MNDVVVKNLYTRITEIRNLFSSYKDEYDKIDTALKTNVFSLNMINILSSLKEKYKMNDDVISIIDHICLDIEVVKNKIYDIKVKKSSINKKVHDIKESVSHEKFNSYNINIVDRNGLKSLSEMDEYLCLLDDEEKRLDKIISDNKNDNISVLESKSLELNIDDITTKDDESTNGGFINALGRVAPNILIMIVVMLLLTVSVFIATGIFNFLK